MIPIASVTQMRECDRITINELGIPGSILMENASRAVAERVISLLDNQPEGKQVAIFCGKGNNGGDGYAIARHLKTHQAEVTVFTTTRTNELSGDALWSAELFIERGGTVCLLDPDSIANLLNSSKGKTSSSFDQPALFVDALLGTGFRGTPDGITTSLINFINSYSSVLVIAVDIPSGVAGDTGVVETVAVRAVETVTFGLKKPGLLLEPGRSYAGNVTVADIGISPEVVGKQAISLFETTYSAVQELLPRRPVTAHKGSVGHAYIIAGSPGMTGSATLSALACQRTGAGLTVVGIPASLNAIMEVKLTEAMTQPLPENGNHHLALTALPYVVTKLEWADAVAFGPGVSTDIGTGALLSGILDVIERPLVIDADGLTLLSLNRHLLENLPKNVVLTPHPGEFSRLTGLTVKEIERDRVSHGRKYAVKWGVTLVLKGAPTIIALPSGAVYINPTGNPGMATGGSGDVLTGVIVSLIAQGLTVGSAAIASVYIHGLAGDRAANKLGQAGMIASDILAELPEVIKDMVGI